MKLAPRKSCNILLCNGLLMIVCMFSAIAQISPAPPGFLNSNALTDTVEDSKAQITTDGAGNWVAVWESHNFNSSPPYDVRDIYFARSTDNGRSWSAPGLLGVITGSLGGRASYNPQLTTDGAGNWIIVWTSYDEIFYGQATDSDIFFVRSADNGLSWSTPELLNTNAASDSGNDTEAQLTTDRVGNWVAVWASDENLSSSGTDSDIFFALSTDNGASWSAPGLLNTNAISDTRSDGAPQLTTDRAGNWVTVWVSGDMDCPFPGVGWEEQIYFALSADNGASWTAPAQLNTNVSADCGQNENPQLTTDGAGNWCAVWESHDEDINLDPTTDRDIYFSRSIDNGATWSATSLLNTNGTLDSGQDEKPQLTTDGAGYWIAAWHSIEDISDPSQDWDIVYAQSTDIGQSWSAPSLLNTNGSSDIGNDYDPQLTTNEAGNWVALWWSNNANPSGEGEGAGAGDYSDIFFTTFTLDSSHTADGNGDYLISLSELLRMIQFFNLGSLYCDVLGEDGFNPGLGDTTCTPHDGDYNPQDWTITLGELLRQIQLFNSLEFYSCPGVGEDGFCLGTA